MLSFIRNLLFKSKPTITFGLERSSEWSTVRNKFIKNGNNFCRYCMTKKNLDVHHILPFHLFPEEELVTSNLITLCQPHHFVIAHLEDWRSYDPDIIDECNRHREKVKNRLYS